MNIFTRFPLRILLPLLLFFIAVFASTAGFLFFRATEDRLIENHAMHYVNEMMVREQLRMEDWLHAGNIEALQVEVKLFSYDEHHGDTVVANEKLQIVSASKQEWIGRNFAEIPLLAEGKRRVDGIFTGPDKNFKGAVFLSQDRQIVHAIFPLVFAKEGNPQQPSNVGFLYHDHKLRTLKAAAQRSLLKTFLNIFAFFAFCSLLAWLFLHFTFSRRVNTILETIKSFGSGKNTARSMVDGSDELASISTALDSMLDIRLALERQLRENEAFLKRLTNGLPVLIAYVDKDERFRFVNQAFENRFQLKSEQIIGQKVRDIVGEEHYAKVVPYIRQALAGEVVEFEATFPLISDKERYCHTTLLPYFENGSGALGYFLLAQDITERKKDLMQVSMAKEQWERTFDAIQDDIITILDTDFCILQANRAAANFFDMPREEIIGKYCYELFRDEALACSECPAFAMLHDQKPHSSEIYHDKLKKHFLVTISPLIDESGEFPRIIHSAKDITALKNLEQQLRQSQKMEAIGTLAGGIAHDFNNILTPIIGYAQLAQTEVPKGSQLHQNILAIQKASYRARDLVKQILAFSRQAEHEKQSLDIRPIIKEALKLLRSSIPATIEIKQEIPSDCGKVLADPTQIHQVLMNLCTNAYHAMREKGGVLTVSLSEVELTANDYLDNLVLQPGKHVKLSIRDTGCGISKVLLERIFEPYFTTKKPGEGTGLGLAVVHGIIQSHHGHLTVYSEPGQGTEFHVYLPIVTKENEKEQAVKGEKNIELLVGSGTILVVDDEKANVELLEKMLTRLGYAVVSYTSSTAALAELKANPAAIDLVLTDMSMPDMTGAELAQEMKQLNLGKPVVLCTGFSEIINAEKAKAIGIDYFLLKPFILNDLAETIHDALQKKKEEPLGAEK